MEDSSGSDTKGTFRVHRDLAMITENSHFNFILCCCYFDLDIYILFGGRLEPKENKGGTFWVFNNCSSSSSIAWGRATESSNLGVHRRQTL